MKSRDELLNITGSKERAAPGGLETIRGGDTPDPSFADTPRAGDRPQEVSGARARPHCAEESTLLYSLSYNPPYSPAQNKRR
jgi:hypothetical protein